MTNVQAVKGSEIHRLDAMKVSRCFGCNTFNERTMRERLPRDVFKAFRHSLKKGEPLSPQTAHGVAQAMMEWALEHGATRGASQRRGAYHVIYYVTYRAATHPTIARRTPCPSSNNASHPPTLSPPRRRAQQARGPRRGR